MVVAFIVLLALFVAENIFLFCSLRNGRSYYEKRVCHHCEAMFSHKEIKNGLTHCSYCGQPLQSWEDYFERYKGAEVVPDDEETKS